MIIDLTSTPHGPYSTLRRPHIDPTSTPHRLYIDRTSTHTQLLFQPTSSFLLFFFHLTSYLEDQRAKARLKWPNEGQTRVKRTKKKDQKGQNQDKRDEKDYRAKFRNTFSSVYVSLGNAPDGPATPIQLGQLYPSTVSPGLLLSK